MRASMGRRSPLQPTNDSDTSHVEKNAPVSLDVSLSLRAYLLLSQDKSNAL